MHPLQQLPGIGPRLAERLEKLGIEKPRDLLFHLPLRYQDRTRHLPIGELRHGEPSGVTAQIESVEIRFARKRSLLVRIADTSDQMFLRFFSFNRKMQENLKVGYHIQCFGQIREGPQGLEMIHPEYFLCQEPDGLPEPEQLLTPIYPTTDGIGQTKIRKLVAISLQNQADELVELLPEGILREHGLMPLAQALDTCHRPTPNDDIDLMIQGIHPAQQRLALEEMLSHRLALWQQRKYREQISAPVFSFQGHPWENLTTQLDYTLTSAQQRVVKELIQDIRKGFPSLRLVQGDVGSGKTIVVAAPALCAIEAGFQVALMAPTEILAGQHYKTFNKWFVSLGISTTLLTGKLSSKQRLDAQKRIAEGESSMIIGTHALFQDQVKFHKLGLLIIDEQHRFGVDQRLALRDKGAFKGFIPHQIIMSATPIPRSLAMIRYANLDISSIDELPPGRKEINTVVMPSSRRDEIAARILSVCKMGQQVYWVCPLIDESETLQAEAATDIHLRLGSRLPALRIGLVHGKMASRDKIKIMEQFSRGSVNLLVSTTVIEVGVDVPNASLMIIENAERLGLAQIHQLRGRVGRGNRQSTCVLMYEPPLGQAAKARLRLLRNTSDGFVIAREDLELRGPGEMLGTRQTGLQKFKIANLVRDRSMIPEITGISKLVQDNYPEIVAPLIARWIPDSDHYSKV